MNGPVKGTRHALPRNLTVVFFVALSVYFLLPVVWLVISATKNTADLYGTSGFWFAHFDLGRNLSDVFSFDGNTFGENGQLARWLLNSFVYSGVGAFGATFISAMAGYGLAKYSFRGREAIFKMVLGGLLIPSTVLALPIFLVLSKLNLTNTYWGVLLPSLVSPFGVYLSRVYATASVPNEIIESARLDGAGELRIFFTMAVRIMSPALATVFLFQFVAIWTNFFLPLMVLTDRNLWPVTLGLFAWQQQANIRPDVIRLVVTGSLVATLPLVITFFTLQRYWRAGIATGSVKL